MKRFHYNLQALLTLRQRAEQKTLELYGAALRTRQEAVDRRDAVHRAQAESWQRWRQEVAQGCTAGALTQWQAGDRNLLEQRHKTEAALSRAEIDVSKALQETLLARRDREAVEKHLEKQRCAYKLELAHHEQNAMDELAQRRIPAAFASSRTPAPSL